MFYDNDTNGQRVADALKRLVGDQQADNAKVKAKRKRALEAIKRFEGAMWRPHAFGLAQANSGIIVTDEQGMKVSPHRESDPGLVFQEIIDLVDRYIEIVQPAQVQGRGDQIFSSKQAAEYLGISLPTLKDHVHNRHTLTGTLVGNSLVFTKAELDEWKKLPRQVGRPPKA